MQVFTHHQLTSRDYNPLEDRAGPDCVDLEARYGQGPRAISLDHAAAIRGILVRDGKEWKWIWGWGLLHDEMVLQCGYDRLWARYRNQFAFLPAIEFETYAQAEPLHLLLRETPIQPDDEIQITGWNSFRAFSIRDALAQLGEPILREVGG